ncbi:MAG: glycosyltransferase family 2 protein [bacterium]|nr:glycosyltransferase family 2 protein [bacterium]
MSAPPLFSVVTCCHNQGCYLRDNIESVLAQRFPSFEHIVVDGGSTDDTRAVCARYPHVRYFYQDDRGQCADLNRGFREARGEIVAWLNSDDYYEPGAFERVARDIAPLRRGRLVTGGVRLVGEDGREIRTLPKGKVPFYRLLLHPRIHSIGGRTSMPCQPSTFFHWDMIGRIGLLDAGLRYAMDYDYWLRAFLAGYRFLYVPRIFSNYRFHSASHSSRGWEAFMPEWTAVSERYLRALPRRRRCAAEWWWLYIRMENALRNRVRALRGRGSAAGDGR